MKRIIQIVASIVLLTSNTSNAQSIPSQGSGNVNSDFWSRSGNLQTTGGNIFFGGLNPLGTTQIFKNLLVSQPGFARRLTASI